MLKIQKVAKSAETAETNLSISAVSWPSKNTLISSFSLLEL